MIYLPRQSTHFRPKLPHVREMWHTAFAFQKQNHPLFLMRTDDKTRGPGGIRTLVRTTYLTHAKISGAGLDNVQFL